jgi:hypothetical protein
MFYSALVDGKMRPFYIGNAVRDVISEIRNKMITLRRTIILPLFIKKNIIHKYAVVLIMQHDCSSQIYIEVPSHNKLPHYFGFVAYGFRNQKVLRSLNVSTRQHSMSLFKCFCRISLYLVLIPVVFSVTVYNFQIQYDPNLKH